MRGLFSGSAGDHADRELYQTVRMMSYAREKHKGQGRKGEQKEVAYINHPLTMVCQALAMHIYDDDILCALLLHDVVEDTNTTLEELPVNDETRELVRLMRSSSAKKKWINTLGISMRRYGCFGIKGTEITRSDAGLPSLHSTPGYAMMTVEK